MHEPLLILCATTALLTTACGDQHDVGPAPDRSPGNDGHHCRCPGSNHRGERRPVRLHFQRTAEDTCADEVVFADLGIRQALPANQTTTLTLPPQPAGTLAFACGMGMMKGKLVVQEGPG